MASLSIEQLRALRAEKRYADATALYRRMYALREESPELFLLGGQVAKAMGDLQAAKDRLEECLILEPSGTILGTARFVLGEVNRMLGHTQPAIDHFTAFLEGIPDYPELSCLLLGAARYNRGLAYRRAGRLDDSLEDYAVACAEFRREGMTDYLRQALQNYAWTACLLGDGLAARQTLTEAAPLCQTTEARWQQKLGEAHLCAVSCFPFGERSAEEARARAVDLCRVICNHEGDDLPDDVRSQSYWLAGATLLQMGDTAGAEDMAARALDFGTLVQEDCRSLYDAADLLRDARRAKKAAFGV